MKYGPIVFLAAFFAMAASWCGLVLAPQVQLGSPIQETNSVEKAELYPMGRPSEGRQGLQVYRANGCAYCHSQQVEQKGTLVDVFLTNVGKDSTAVAKALAGAHGLEASGPGLAAGLPKAVAHNLTMEEALTLQKVLKDAGAKSEFHLVPTGADIERGWGVRRTVAQDFVMDYPVMTGSQRVGPDLANVGIRKPDMNWQLMHLYAPRSVTPESPMPAYPFLFEKKKIGKAPSADALALPKEFAPEAGYEIVPKAEAKALAAYLLSLRAETPLYEAPLTPAAAPAAKAAAATNAPAK